MVSGHVTGRLRPIAGLFTQLLCQRHHRSRLLRRLRPRLTVRARQRRRRRAHETSRGLSLQFPLLSPSLSLYQRMLSVS